MANILSKPFDVTKNIIRTVFLARPNLFTTSDLNRQLEAIKYQIDKVEGRVGAESNILLSVEGNGSKVTCKVVTGSYLRVCGLSLPIPQSTESFEVAAGYGVECYFYVWGDIITKTYNNDRTHEIAGAKFDDNTSKPAANQLVLSNVHYTITKDITDITDSTKDFCFLIAKIKVIDSGNTSIHLNYKKVGNSLMTDAQTTLDYIQPGPDSDLNIGDDFNTCINKLIIKNNILKNTLEALSDSFKSAEVTRKTLLSDRTYDDDNDGFVDIEVYLEGRNFYVEWYANNYKDSTYIELHWDINMEENFIPYGFRHLMREFPITTIYEGNTEVFIENVNARISVSTNSAGLKVMCIRLFSENRWATHRERGTIYDLRGKKVVCTGRGLEHFRFPDGDYPITSPH